MFRVSRQFFRTACAFAIGAAAMFPFASQAVPSFARQTGAVCSSCHLGFTELTAKGRLFKLGGYIGDKPGLPLAAGIQLSATSSKKPAPGISDEAQFKDDGEVVVQSVGVFYGGKITERTGALINYVHEPQEDRGRLEMADIRFADATKLGDGNFAWGVTVNNTPGLQDIWNTWGIFSFPFNGPGELSALTPPPRVRLDGVLESQVAGVSAYGWWNRSLYVELGGYLAAEGVFSVFRYGVPREEVNRLDGFNPYWRVAYQYSFGEGRTLHAGIFGLIARQFPDNLDPNGPTDRYRDLGFDASFDFSEDDHRVRATVAYIREKQELGASVGLGAAQNESNTLESTKARVTYYYQRRYGATLGYFSTTGSADSIRYEQGEELMGSKNGTPDSQGYVLELNWLPIESLKLGLQYTAYSKFMGFKDDYDGFGRNASDNNTTFVFGQWLF